MLQKIENLLKKFINSFRWPRLLSIGILENGKKNPTIEEMLADAPPANENWDRIGFGKIKYGAVKVWMIWLSVALALGLWLTNFLVQLGLSVILGPNDFLTDYVVMICDLVFRVFLMILLALHFWQLVKSFGKQDSDTA